MWIEIIVHSNLSSNKAYEQYSINNLNAIGNYVIMFEKFMLLLSKVLKNLPLVSRFWV